MTGQDTRIGTLAVALLVCACSGAPPPPSYATYVISAGDLIGAYATNEVAADSKFDGHWIDVSGIVTSIGLDILKTPYVTLGPSGTLAMPSVQAMFTRNEDEGLVSTFTKGQTLTLRCKVDGKLLNILVSDCRKL